uniref:Methyltransferase type 11 domain-containing protein n=1 Tax=Amorphochlora amoebiformis TaxID=1561963 RepID=A0A7S0DLR7_9EUKA|mmetsp:Transcript_33724/g.54305  ORF Transcript_33724/g.54305 Transcript_33724/m.54305 type:complete len:319 (+) Transcript_33724:31-987(+)
MAVVAVAQREFQSLWRSILSLSSNIVHASRLRIVIICCLLTCSSAILPLGGGLGGRTPRGRWGRSKYRPTRRICPPVRAAGDLQVQSLLTAQERKKLDRDEDKYFYSLPRMVQHVDESFLDQLTALYRRVIPPNSHVLDLCTAFDSHLPLDVPYASVTGQGMNEKELEANPRLTRWYVRDQNENPTIDMPDRSVDAVVMCVSIQYMARPEELFQEIFRVLKPGGVVVISFSNRMFYSKAIQAWRDGTDRSRADLVSSYFTNIQGFTRPEVITSVGLPGDPPEFLSFGGGGTQTARAIRYGGVPDPFTAVIAYRNLKRV